MSTSDSFAIELGGHLWKNLRVNRCSILPNKRPRFGLLEEPRSEIFQIATPGLPLMVCTGRFVENVLNVCFMQRIVQALESGAHSLRFCGSDTKPEQVYFLGECRRISEDSVVIGFGV